MVAALNGEDSSAQLRAEWDSFRGEVIGEVSSLTTRLSTLIGRMDRLATVQKGMNDAYADVVRNYRTVLERLDEAQELRETTEIRQLRRAQLEQLRTEAKEARDDAETIRLTVRATKRRSATWAAVGIVLAPAIMKLIEGLAAHWK